MLSLFYLRSALTIFSLLCGLLWFWPEDPKIISQCYGNPLLCFWIPYSAKMFVGFFLYILYKKRPQSVCPQGRVNPWLCPSNLSSCPSVSTPFPAWGNTYFYAPEVFCQVCTLALVLWGLVKRLLELEEGKNAYNSLEEPREGLYLFSCFIPVKLFIGICWKVPFSHCTLPLVCQWYVNLRRCCASKILHGDSGLVGWWFTLMHGHQTLRSLLWGSCPVLELLSLSGSSQLTEAKGVKPKHFMGSLFDARISLVSQFPP